MYTNEEYNLPMLNFHIPFRPKDMGDSKKELNTIFNQIQFTIKKLNFIVDRRMRAVNEYRHLQGEHDDLRNKEIFDKENTKERQSEVSKKQSPVLWTITIDTEIYFVYVTILLDSIADLIFYYDDLTNKTRHNFTKLYHHILDKGCKNQFVQKQFRENLQWYPLTIQTPRNKLTIHDKITSGMSWNDHGIDFSVGKAGEQFKNPELLTQLKEIIKNHPNEYQIREGEEYIHPILREIIRKPSLLSPDEIVTIKKISKNHAVFPYVIDVQQNLINFLNFMQSMFPSMPLPNYW